MRMVYTNANRFIVSNARNILEGRGFDIFLKNEHTASVIGEVSPFDTWLELWVVDDADYDAACRILEGALSDADAPDWHCPKCGEQNDVSFEHCWKCQCLQPMPGGEK